jgi:hypothetical protein
MVMVLVFAKLMLAFAILVVLVFFAVTEEVFVWRCGGLRLRVAGGFEFVVLGRELKNAPRTSSSDCWALAKNTPEKADTNTITKMISLDISYLPLVTTLQSGTGVSPVNHAPDARGHFKLNLSET